MLMPTLPSRVILYRNNETVFSKNTGRNKVTLKVDHYKRITRRNFGPKIPLSTHYITKRVSWNGLTFHTRTFMKKKLLKTADCKDFTSPVQDYYFFELSDLFCYYKRSVDCCPKSRHLRTITQFH